MKKLKLPPLNSSFEKAEGLYFFDRVLLLMGLRYVPKSIKPNHITLFRFFATPIVAVLMFYGQYQSGLIAFLIVAFSDAVDGALARSRDQITEWGKIYDPIADKILISAMVFIIVLRYIDPWAAFIIVMLEFIIVVVGWFRLRRGIKMQANVWGKIKMILQVGGVVILLFSIIFDWAAILPLASGTLYLAIAFAIVSLLTYGI